MVILRVMSLLALLMTPALVVAACGTADPQAGGASSTPTDGATPIASGSGGTAIIDWVDFVRFNGISYLAGYPAAGERSLTGADLGEPFATVRFMLSENVRDPEYRIQDGDAAFLPAGTPVYAVKGYRPEFRLAARRDGRIVLYEADTNPNAKTGADLLDIDGKVRAIAVQSAQDGSELARIDDPARIVDLVAMILAAPIDQRAFPGDARYIVVFQLNDGTSVRRAYFPTTGELARGIKAPDAFRAALEEALNAAAVSATPTPRPESANLVEGLGLERARSIYLKGPTVTDTSGQVVGLRTITEPERVQAIVAALTRPLAVVPAADPPLTEPEWQRMVVVGFTFADGRYATLWYDRKAGSLTDRDWPGGPLGVAAPPGFGAILGLD